MIIRIFIYICFVVLFSDLASAYRPLSIHHPYFALTCSQKYQDKSQCRLFSGEEYTDSPISNPRNANNTIVLFSNEDYQLNFNSEFFNSSTMRYIFSLQSDLTSFIAKVEDKLIMLRMILSAKIERDIRATKAASDFVLRSVSKGGDLDVEDLIRPVLGLAESLQSSPLLLPLLPPPSASPLIAGLDATSTKQRARRPRMAGRGHGLGVDSVYRSVRSLPNQVQYDFNRFRRRKAAALPSSGGRAIPGLPAAQDEAARSIRADDPVAAYFAAPASAPVSVGSVLTAEVLASLAELFALYADTEHQTWQRVREAKASEEKASTSPFSSFSRQTLALAAQYCEDCAQACAQRPATRLEHSVEDAALLRDAVQLVLARVAAERRGAAAGDVEAQLVELADYLTASVDSCRAGLQIEAADYDSGVEPSAPQLLRGGDSVYDVDTGEILASPPPPRSPAASASLSYLGNAGQEDAQHSPASTSAAAVIDTEATALTPASAQVASRALVALDVALFLAEKLLLALPPLLQRTGEVLEKLLETYGLSLAQRNPQAEGQWLLLAQLSGDRRSKRTS